MAPAFKARPPGHCPLLIPGCPVQSDCSLLVSEVGHCGVALDTQPVLRAGHSPQEPPPRGTPPIEVTASQPGVAHSSQTSPSAECHQGNLHKVAWPIRLTKHFSLGHPHRPLRSPSDRVPCPRAHLGSTEPTQKPGGRPRRRRCSSSIRTPSALPQEGEQAGGWLRLEEAGTPGGGAPHTLGPQEPPTQERQVPRLSSMEKLFVLNER